VERRKSVPCSSIFRIKAYMCDEEIAFGLRNLARCLVLWNIILETSWTA
jgi:hypothetical protein